MNHRLAILAVLAVLAAGEHALGQVMRQKIEGSGLQQTDQFGISTGISGDWAVVGADGADDLAPTSGAAYVFARTSSGWVEQQRLKAGDPTDSAGFGHSVAIEGSTIAIGAPGATYQGMQNVGAVYIFDFSAGTWSQTIKLVPNDAGTNYALGYSVAMSGNRVIAGADYESHAGLHSGAAYIFECTAGTWSQAAKVVANDAAMSDLFGYSVALHGDLAVVGSVLADYANTNDVGAVYVYERQGAQWPQTQKLISPNPSGLQYYGISVGANADSILVGAGANNYALLHAGVTLVYQYTGTTWVQTQILTPADLAIDDFFGQSVAISGDHAVIGSNSDDMPQASGAHYIFTEVGSTWIETGKCIAPDMIYGDAMGDVAAIDGTTILAGEAQGDGACPTLPSCNSGSAYFFEFAPEAAQYGSGSTGCPCSNADGHGGCINSTGQGAVLAACGSNSASADDLLLEARWLPPSVNALAFMGQGTASFFLGDGLRVVGPAAGSGLYRFPVHQADANGVLTYGPGLVASSMNHAVPGQIQPGQSWNFQVWYRNVGGPCGSGSNTTNGLSVTFVP